MDSSQQNNNPSENYNNNPPQNIQQKKGKGRKKTTNEKIENKIRRQVSFSKRRTGLFKKANEIGTLCATESVFIVHSPAGKVHSFGSPSVERVAHRFLNQTEHVHGQTVMGEYSEELANLESQLALEKKCQKESLRMQTKMQEQEGIPPHLDELNFQQLDGLLNRASSVKMDFEWGNLNLGINNSNVVFSSNPSANYDLDATYFTGNANPSLVEPFNNPMTSNLGFPSQYPPRASGSSFMSSFHYGNCGDASILNDGEIGGTSVEAKHRRHSYNNNGCRRGRGN